MRKNKGKQIVEDHWRVAFNIVYRNSIISIEGTIDECFERGRDSNKLLREVFSDREINPEIQLIKRDCFEHLSNRSKDMLNLIFDGPKEVRDAIISPVYGVVSKHSIKKFFLAQGWKRSIIDHCFNELSELTKML